MKLYAVTSTDAPLKRDVRLADDLASAVRAAFDVTIDEVVADLTWPATRASRTARPV